MKYRDAGFRIMILTALLGVVILAACAPVEELPVEPASAQPLSMLAILQKIADQFHIKVWQEFPKKYSTPQQAAAGIAVDYRWNVIPSTDFLQNFYSPLVTLSRMERQCDETALLVAYAVEDDGYPPLVMFLYSEDQNYIGANHALFIFQQQGKWGYTDWTHYVPAQYSTIEELFYSYQHDEPAYVSYTLFNFNLYKEDWKGSDRPLIVGDNIAIAKGPTTIWLFRTPLLYEADTTTQSVKLIDMNSGSVDNENVVSSAMLVGLTNACCGLPPVETEALMTFDLSQLPKDAQIVSVLVDFRQFLFYGKPFERYQCLEVYNEAFSDIRLADFEQQPEGFLTRWCTQQDLSTPLYLDAFRKLVQQNLDQGMLQLRLKFKIPDAGEGLVGNQMVFNPNIMLVITYSLKK